MIRLTYKITEGACPCHGWNLDMNTQFDANDYALCYHLNVHDIDQDDIKRVHNVQAGLNEGEWLTVDHE